ncbi:hypothetical protein B0H12DRAFT_224953 [Mycena haematopus]|nr:hypothetical protein B0H12DRAFT_224953 [Mycena haematopus]
MLLMPMPFLNSAEADSEAHDIGKPDRGMDLSSGLHNITSENSESRGLKRILSRRPREAMRRRNSLVLPDVRMPDGPYEPETSRAQPYQCTVRESPPPMEDRTIRFLTPPPKFAPPQCRGADEEPAWSDFM